MEARAMMAKDGLLSHRQDDGFLYMHCTRGVVDSAEDLGDDQEDEGLLRRLGKRTASRVKDYNKDRKALKKIKQYEGKDFDKDAVAADVLQLYKETHALLGSWRDNEARLVELCTEDALIQMLEGMRRRSLVWRFVENLEPPRVVRVRVAELSEEDLFGQITVRLMTRQQVALYDRFGRLVYGHPEHAQDLLEYVVVEKHIVDEYGSWRIHAKQSPEWLQRKLPYLPTFRLRDAPESAVDGANPAQVALSG